MRKKEPGESLPIYVAIGIIFILSSLFSPFVIITIIQDIFFRPDIPFWLFQAPISSYFVTGITFFLVGIAILILVFFMYKEILKKSTKNLMITIMLVSGITAIFLASNQYYYFTEKGVYHNDYFRTSEKEYLWENMESATYILVNESGVLRETELQLTTKDGEIKTYSYNDHLRDHRHKINQALESVNAKIEYVEIEE